MRHLFLFFLLFFANTTFAVQVTSIYQAEVPVASQSPEERDKAIPTGLAQVLVKVSGKTSVLDNPNLKAALSKAPSLLQEYGYSTEKEGELIKIRFDSEGVNKLLRDAKASIWGKDRPLILVWAEYETPNQAGEIIGSDSSNEIQRSLKQQAGRRGLPFIFPMMDMADMNLVSVNDIVTMAIGTLQNASKRYSSDAILAARILKTPAGFMAETKLTMGNDTWGWNVSGKNLTAVLNSVVDNVTDALAIRYSSVESNSVQSRMVVKITGITQETDFADVMNYIQHIAAVADAEPMKISGNDVLLQVNLRGTRDAFIQAIALDKKLSSVASESNENLLVYQWTH